MLKLTQEEDGVQVTLNVSATVGAVFVGFVLPCMVAMTSLWGAWAALHMQVPSPISIAVITIITLFNAAVTVGSTIIFKVKLNRRHRRVYLTFAVFAVLNEAAATLLPWAVLYFRGMLY